MVVEIVVKIDEKGRILIPKRIRKRLETNHKQRLVILLEDDKSIIAKKRTLDSQTNPLLYDIMINPGHVKVSVTSKLPNKMKEEVEFSNLL